MADTVMNEASVSEQELHELERLLETSHARKFAWLRSPAGGRIAQLLPRLLSSLKLSGGSAAQSDRLYEAIAHGDAVHREWLREALDAFFAGKPVPPPRSAAQVPPPMPSTAGWLPISTAPKDGTPFLACSGNWRTVGFWHKHRRCWAVSGPAYESYPADEQPTHWQLLPAPSQEGASEGGARTALSKHRSGG